MPFSWDQINVDYSTAKKTWARKFGAEVIEAIFSIPDTATFIEFIYEEATQTLLFALYNAIKFKDVETARAIIDYAKTELLPDAVNFVAFWGNLAPHTKTAFQRFFDAADFSIRTYEAAISLLGAQEGTITIYTNVDDVDIYVDGVYKGKCSRADPLRVKVSAGSHGVEAFKPGYFPTATQVRIDPTEYQIVKLNLKPIQEEGVGVLVVYTNKPNTRVYVNDEEAGTCSPEQPLYILLPTGTYMIKAIVEGYAEQYKTATIKEKETTIISFAFE